MMSDIRALDSEQQMLVYENYSKFITATDMISQMKSRVDTMDVRADLISRVLYSNFKLVINLHFYPLFSLFYFGTAFDLLSICNVPFFISTLPSLQPSLLTFLAFTIFDALRRHSQNYTLVS
jgi:hypothetical protein